MFEPIGANVVSIDGGPCVAALAQFLSHLPFQTYDAIESVVKAGGFHRLQPGEDGRERATKFPLRWDRMVCCVCHWLLTLNFDAFRVLLS
jgi:hypothetical protein